VKIKFIILPFVINRIKYEIIITIIITIPGRSSLCPVNSSCKVKRKTK